MIKGLCRLALPIQRLRLPARASQASIPGGRRPPGPCALHSGPAWSAMAPKTRKAAAKPGPKAEDALDSEQTLVRELVAWLWPPARRT